MSTCGGALAILSSVRQNFVSSQRKKNVVHVWAIANHKSQITNHKPQNYDCDTQTQMRYGNAPIFEFKIVQTGVATMERLV